MFFVFSNFGFVLAGGRTKALNSLPGWGVTESVFFARGPRWNTPIQVLFTAKLLFRRADTLCCWYRENKTGRLRKEINVTKRSLFSFSFKSMTWIYGWVECIQQRGISTGGGRELPYIVLWPLDNNAFKGFPVRKARILCVYISRKVPPLRLKI